MIGTVLKKVFGSKNERELKRLVPSLEAINALEDKYRSMEDKELARQTALFLERLEQGEGMEDILNEAFAVVREVARRTINMRHFDVQIIGGLVLHEGKIAEMKTGEGKTLVAALPLYLNALTTKGAHLVTVNDYLARRDAQWMGPIYLFLGLTVGVIQHDASFLVDWDPSKGRYGTRLTKCSRREAYQANITYGTNNEFGFDYLRDNMKFSIEDYVQRELHYAIVDEVDSILIDEARTPLIISGPAEESTDKYHKIDRVAPKLIRDEDYAVDEKAHSITLTEEGIPKVERLLHVENLYDPRHIGIVHHVNQALKAHVLFKRDVDYVVKDGKVVIVDEFTGRLMPGRRWSDGLHQAVEAKEHLKIERENQTLASVTFQNYFRMYEKLAGMTGTAETEAAELAKIYDLDVIVIPTNKTLIRNNYPDVIYKTEEEKFRAVINEIKELYERGQPVLVGTIAIEKSELLSRMLKKEGIPHHVLNAKHHEKEAEIIAQAGRFGAVTISTNMAGRGTDIVLGGNPEMLALGVIKPGASTEELEEVIRRFEGECKREKERVIEAGGLHILGTERHEARRIDNQLRGRSGRQGDPGSSRFYLSLEDDLLRIFGSERISGMMDRLGIEEDQPIEHKWISKAVENAQRKVEAHNFDIRKHLLEYDDVMNKQREVIYTQRKKILTNEDLKKEISEMVEDMILGVFPDYIPQKSRHDEWDMEGLGEFLSRQFSFNPELPGSEAIAGFDSPELKERVMGLVNKRYEEKEDEIGPEMMRRLEKYLLLNTVDYSWKEHLLNMDHLKEGIGLRGYGQRDPLREYQREAYEMFEDMMDRITMDFLEKIYRIQIQPQQDISFRDQPRQQRMFLSRGEGTKRKARTVRRDGKKVGRNEPCPCGSGRKYKKCCGA